MFGELPFSSRSEKIEVFMMNTVHSSRFSLKHSGDAQESSGDAQKSSRIWEQRRMKLKARKLPQLERRVNYSVTEYNLPSKSFCTEICSDLFSRTSVWQSKFV